MHINKIEILWRSSPKQLKIDGVLYSVKDAAVFLEVTKESLRVMVRRAKRDPEKLRENINDLHWKRDNNISANKTIFHLDGERYIIDDFMRDIPCNHNTARSRANTAVRLNQSYEYATRPINEERKKRAIDSRNYGLKKETFGLGPRRSIFDVPDPTKYEYKLPLPAAGVPCKRSS